MARCQDRRLLALVATVGLALGCSAIVGVQDVKLDDRLGGSTSREPDAGKTRGSATCKFARDCPEVDATPAGCATAACVTGMCVYSTFDDDQDGHTSARCVATDGTDVELGDDCDDADPQLFPGHPEDCAETATGSAIAFPNNHPVGSCKFGQRSCEADGTASSCVGAVGPKPVAGCTPEEDESCTGNPLESCSCTAGQTVACGTSSSGSCKKGTATCQANGTYGPCVGAVAPGPRDCGSAGDNDCNGVPDAQEPACRCAGGAASGTKRACNTHPGYDLIGTCKAGTQTCTASAGAASWSVCTGAVGPQSELCDGFDRDCNGTPGADEPAAPPPAGAMSCATTYRCAAADRGAIYYRTGIGWTWYSGGGTLWTGYALDGPHVGAVQLARDSATGQKLGALNGTCGGTTLGEAMSTFRTLP